MQYHKVRKGYFDTTEDNNTYEEKELRDFSACKQDALRASKAFKDIDISKNVGIKGCRSHFSNRQNNRICQNNVCKEVLQPNTTSNVGEEKNFDSRKYSRWDSTWKSHRFENRKNISNIATSNNSIKDLSTNKPKSSTRYKETNSPKGESETLLEIFLKRSSIYAFNQMGNSKSTSRKVFWVLIMFIGIIGSGFYIMQYLTAYFTYPVVVSMDSKYTLDQEFPAVTICNLNRVKSKFMPCVYSKTSYELCSLSVMNKEIPDFALTEEDDACPEFESKMNMKSLSGWLKNVYLSIDRESQKYYGHQKADFIKSCSFNGEICGLENFTESIDFDYGNCYTFNAANGSISALKTRVVGPNSGLEIDLELEVEEYYGFSTPVVGARVQIHDPFHAQTVVKQGINISPGFETSVTLTKSARLRLKDPFKDKCKDYSTGDSMATCNDRCLNEIIQNRCSCSLSGKSELRHCNLYKKSDFCCINKQDEEQRRVCDCPLSCNETSYNINTFSARWPSPPYYETHQTEWKTPENIERKRDLSLKEVRETRLKLKVYYESFETSVYEQNPKYQNSEVYSQIGAQMGLWLGLSLIVILECMENLFVLMFLWYRSVKLRQISQQCGSTVELL